MLLDELFERRENRFDSTYEGLKLKVISGSIVALKVSTVPMRA